MIKVWLKRMLWALGLLVLVPVALAVAWGLSNWRDAPAQDWPQALVPPPDTLADGDNLYEALRAVKASSPSLRMPDCKGDDCRAAWRAQAAKWLAQRRAHAPFGELCEAQAQRPGLRFEDPVPDSAEPIPHVAVYGHVVQCSNWLLTQAWEASEAQQSAQALAKLEQADRLHRAVLNGARTLIGHSIALAMLHRQMQVLTLVGEQHAELSPALRPLAAVAPPQLAAAQRRWIAAEASFNRAVTLTLPNDFGCDAAVGSDFVDRVGCRLQRLGYQPNYTLALFANHWQAALADLDDRDPLAAVAAQRQRAAKPLTGWMGTQFRWHGTTAHVLVDVAKPAYASYFERTADLHLSSSATALWLQARAQAIPRAEQAAWLNQQVSGSPLAQHLRRQDDGSWQLRPLQDSATRVVTRWPSPA